MGRQSGGIRGTYRPRITLADIREEDTVYKSKGRQRKDRALETMIPLLGRSYTKPISEGRNIGIKFTPEGNEHLYSDIVGGRTKRLRKSDLPNMGEILSNATYVGSEPYQPKPDKPKKNAIHRNTYFHYYRARVRGKTIYINIRDMEAGKHRERIVYSVVDRIKQ